MILRAYSIFDRKALQYHPPFFTSTDGQAVRSLTDAVGDSNTSLSRHPQDYVLYYVGDYDDQKGALMPVAPLVHVIDAIAVVPASTGRFFDHPLDDVVGLVKPNGQGVVKGEDR